jgi:hypothetical protein
VQTDGRYDSFEIFPDAENNSIHGVPEITFWVHSSISHFAIINGEKSPKEALIIEPNTYTLLDVLLQHKPLH